MDATENGSLDLGGRERERLMAEHFLMHFWVRQMNGGGVRRNHNTTSSGYVTIRQEEINTKLVHIQLEMGFPRYFIIIS